MSFEDNPDFGSENSANKSYSGYESDLDSVINGQSSDSGRDTIESTVEYPLVFRANFLLFGTYMSYCRCVQLDRLFLKMTSVTPNILGIRFTYNISIGFSDITRLYYCSDPIESLIFLELSKESSHLIQIAMNLGEDSLDRLKFDSESDDVVERYLVIDVSQEESYEQIVGQVISCAKAANNEIIIRKMRAENAKRYLRQNHRKCEASYRLYRMKVNDNHFFNNFKAEFSPN